MTEALNALKALDAITKKHGRDFGDLINHEDEVGYHWYNSGDLPAQPDSLDMVYAKEDTDTQTFTMRTYAGEEFVISSQEFRKVWPRFWV